MLCFIAFFTHRRFVATLPRASLLVPFFHQHLFTLSLCHIFVILAIFQTFHYYYICHDDLREGSGTPLQYSCLENPMDGGAWWSAVHGVAESWTRLSDFTFTFHFHALEKAMAPHSNTLVWRTPGTVEPGELPSLGLHRVRQD